MAICFYEFLRLSLEQSVELLEGVGGLHEVSSVHELIELLQYNPIMVALAASSIKKYNSILPSSDWQASVDTYQRLLKQCLNAGSDGLQATLTLYFEAARIDSRFSHAFDFLGSCDLNYPVLTAVLPIHLSQDFYGLSDGAFAPPPLDSILANLKSSVEQNSYWSRMKSFVPFLQPNGPSDDDISKALVASQDEVAFIRQSPILSFEHSWGGELMTVHSVAHLQISELFNHVTVSKLDKDFLTREENSFQQKGWFKSYRTFDGKKSLGKFHRTLPGLSCPGVLTETQFDANLMKQGSETTGTKIPEEMAYSQYVHLVSHYHRVTSSLVSALRSVKGDIPGTLMKKCLSPHFVAIGNFPCVSQGDKLAADMSLVTIDATSCLPKERSRCISQYRNLITKQRTLFGSKSVEVASSLVDLADLQLFWNDNITSAKELLQSSVKIYSQVPPHLQHRMFSLDMSHALSSLGAAYGELGELEKSKDVYDQALAIAQSPPPNGVVGQQQRKLVASLLVNITHAYLCLGDLSVAKKYCELAVMMLQSVYPQGHVETVRLFNIRSIISSLSGNKEDSTKSRLDASKLKSKLEQVIL